MTAVDGRPRLDLEAVRLPLELSATPRTIDRQTADGWIAALGERHSARTSAPRSSINASVRTDTEVTSSVVVKEVASGVVSFELAMECDGEACLVGRASVPVEGTTR